MNARISIDFEFAEGAVLRMLGLVERRGFEIRGIGMVENERGAAAKMMLELAPRDASRRIEVLDLQLRRLHGVHDVVTNHPPAGPAS